MPSRKLTTASKRSRIIFLEASVAFFAKQQSKAAAASSIARSRAGSLLTHAALILALLVVVATIFLWPLAAVAVLYVIYRVFGVHPELLIYIAAFVGIIAIAMIWWWHVANTKS